MLCVLFNCYFNVRCLSCLTFSAVINSPVMKISCKKFYQQFYDFLGVDYQNLHYYFKEMNILKTLPYAFGNQLMKHYFHEPNYFLWILSWELSLLQLLYSSNHSIYILEERRKASMWRTYVWDPKLSKSERQRRGTRLWDKKQEREPCHKWQRLTFI